MINFIYKINRKIKINSFNKKEAVSGFSIIEIIIYLAIFTALSILVINSFIVLLSSFNRTNMNRKISESGLISMERISREIRQAKDIDLESNSDTLILDSIDSDGNLIKIKFIKEGGEFNLYLNDNIDKEGNLLNKNILIDDLFFRIISTTQGKAVKIEMTLQYNDGKNIKTENFYNTVALRGGF